MDKIIISHRIRDVLDEVGKLNSHLYAIDSLDIQRYPESYETMSTEAALRAEKIACQLRSLLYASTGISKKEYLTKASEVQGVEVSCADGILEIFLPRLLKKKARQSSMFLLDPLHAALERCGEENPMPRFRECVVCITHVYAREIPDWRLLDYDNMQQKQVIDMVALHVMVDDSGLLCDVYNTTEPGEKDCTKITVMEKERFAEWLFRRERRVKPISDF